MIKGCCCIHNTYSVYNSHGDPGGGLTRIQVKVWIHFILGVLFALQLFTEVNGDADLRFGSLCENKLTQTLSQSYANFVTLLNI